MEASYKIMYRVLSYSTIMCVDFSSLKYHPKIKPSSQYPHGIMAVLVRYNQAQKCFQNSKKCLIYIAGKQTSGRSRNFQRGFQIPLNFSLSVSRRPKKSHNLLLNIVIVIRLRQTYEVSPVESPIITHYI